MCLAPRNMCRDLCMQKADRVSFSDKIGLILLVHYLPFTPCLQKLIFFRCLRGQMFQSLFTNILQTYCQQVSITSSFVSLFPAFRLYDKCCQVFRDAGTEKLLSSAEPGGDRIVSLRTVRTEGIPEKGESRQSSLVVGLVLNKMMPSHCALTIVRLPFQVLCSALAHSPTHPHVASCVNL